MTSCAWRRWTCNHWCRTTPRTSASSRRTDEQQQINAWRIFRATQCWYWQVASGNVTTTRVSTSIAHTSPLLCSHPSPASINQSATRKHGAHRRRCAGPRLDEQCLEQSSGGGKAYSLCSIGDLYSCAWRNFIERMNELEPAPPANRVVGSSPAWRQSFDSDKTSV